MFKRIVDYIKNNHIVMYLFLGVLTTAVNYVVYFPLYNICGISAAVSNIIAWSLSVVVAFLTNKPLVFKSMNWSVTVALPEFIKFVGCRLLSGLLETLFVYVFVDILLWNGNILKILISAFVVISNYAFSKLLVFDGR